MSRANPDLPVSTCPHASLPPRRLRLRAPIGLHPQGFIPIRRAGQGGVMLDDHEVTAAGGWRLAVRPRSLPGLLRRYLRFDLFLELHRTFLATQHVILGHSLLQHAAFISGILVRAASQVEISIGFDVIFLHP